MRTALLAAALCSVSAFAAARNPVVAFFPPTSNDVRLQQLALLMEARASELVEETNKVSELHLKQTLRVINEEAFNSDLKLDGNVEALRIAAGADRAVSFSLEAAGEELLLSGVMVDGKKPKAFTAKLPKNWSPALEQGSVALAKALLNGTPLPKKTNAQPSSANEEALQQLGACYPVVLRQPLSVDTPALIDGAELERAVAACVKAAELDPSLRFANAVASLGQSILGGDAAAAKSLAALGNTDDVLEIYTLARFWLLTRYQSNEAGVAFLQDVIKKHPGELIARAYLGDTQFALGAWADAEKTFQGYVALAPASPWAQARLSKAFARQGKHTEAIAAAKKAFLLSPSSPETRLELGSRYIDAGNLAEAQETLEPLSKQTPPRAEHVLRLGWAHWLEGELEAAEAYFQRAVDLSTNPGDWRTKGRASYDLALVEAKRGRTKEAAAQLKAAYATGFKVKDLDPSLTAAAKEMERADMEKKPTPPPSKTVTPREASLFPVNAFGDVDTGAKKPPAPEGLILFKF
ncbi:MAG: tetratricopeptide repeat protein [Archangium sp.]